MIEISSRMAHGLLRVRRTAIVFVILASLPVVLGVAGAQTMPPADPDAVTVYASEEGEDLGPIFLATASDSSFDLYVDAGSAVSSVRDACTECAECDGGCSACDFCSGSISDPSFGAPCTPAPNGGDGNEICGLDVEITLSGDARITSFAPNTMLCNQTATFASFPTEFLYTTTNLRFNLLCGIDALPPGVHRLGTLGVNLGELAPETFATVSVSGRMAVGANRQARSVPVNLIGVPEPGIWLGMGVGIGGLLLFHARRTRSKSGRV